MIKYKGIVYSASKFGAKPLLVDLDKMIEHCKSYLTETKSQASNPQVAEQRAKHQGRLEVLESLQSDEAWRIYKRSMQS